jgi:hypothetical protein
MLKKTTFIILNAKFWCTAVVCNTMIFLFIQVNINVF